METFFALLALCGDFTGHRSERPVTQSFGVLFDVRLDKRLSKQSGNRWFETPSRPLWYHSDVGKVAADVPRDVWLTVSGNHAQFVLSSPNMQSIECNKNPRILPLLFALDQFVAVLWRHTNMFCDANLTEFSFVTDVFANWLHACSHRRQVQYHDTSSSIHGNITNSS